MKNINTVTICLAVGLLYVFYRSAEGAIGAGNMAVITKIVLLTSTLAIGGWVMLAVIGVPVGLIAQWAAAGRGKRAETVVRESESRRIDADTYRLSQESMAIARRREAEAVKVEAEALVRIAEARRIVIESRHTAVSGHHVVVIDNQTGRIGQYVPPPKQILQQQEPQPELVNAGPQYTAIDIIQKIADRMRGTKNAPRFIFAGPTRAGKTFTAMRVTEIIDADYYALDPKAADPEEPWPQGVKVVGQGDNWPQMERFFTWIMQQEQPRRAALMQSNPAAFKRMPKVIIFLEELLSTLMARPEFATAYITILTKYAQFGIGIIPITHATTATAMGFKPGQSELKNCFDAIFRFDYDVLSDTRKSFVTLRGQQEMELAPFKFAGHSHTVTPKKAAFWGVTGGCDPVTSVTSGAIQLHPTAGYHAQKQQKQRFYESKADKSVCDSYESGLSLRGICEKMGLPINGKNTLRVKTTLAKYNIQDRR